MSAVTNLFTGGKKPASALTVPAAEKPLAVDTTAAQEANAELMRKRKGAANYVFAGDQPIPQQFNAFSALKGKFGQ